eukprot:323848-Hanusia_phi.AAC.1
MKENSKDWSKYPGMFKINPSRHWSLHTRCQGAAADADGRSAAARAATRSRARKAAIVGPVVSPTPLHPFSKGPLAVNGADRTMERLGAVLKGLGIPADGQRGAGAEGIQATKEAVHPIRHRLH